MDEYDDFDEDYACEAKNIFYVLDQFKRSNEFLSKGETQELCDIYKKLFPPKDGVYIINYARINALTSAVIDETLRDLVNTGLMEISCDEVGEFIFSISELGREYLKESGYGEFPR